MDGAHDVAESLASAARQLNYALDESSTTAEAFQRLYAAVDPRQQAALRQLEILLHAPEPEATVSKSLRLSAFPTLAWLLRQSTSPERGAAALFAEFRRHQLLSGTALVVWREFTGFLTYLCAVFTILVVVAAICGIFVLPEFNSLYAGFGYQLPVLTRLVFGPWAPVFMLMLLMAAVLLAAMAWFVFHLRRQIRRFLPLPDWYQRMPLIGPVASAYHRHLWLSYTALLRAARMPADEALKVAGTRLRVDLGPWGAPAGEAPVNEPLLGSGLTGDLSIAARLGKLEEETQFQQEATADTFLTALVRCRRRARVFLSLLIYLLVAIFVSGMYLPIFSLGSAI